MLNATAAASAAWYPSLSLVLLTCKCHVSCWRMLPCTTISPPLLHVLILLQLMMSTCCRVLQCVRRLGYCSSSGQSLWPLARPLSSLLGMWLQLHACLQQPVSCHSNSVGAEKQGQCAERQYSSPWQLHPCFVLRDRQVTLRQLSAASTGVRLAVTMGSSGLAGVLCYSVSLTV
jgi:hypothetical protein